MGDDFLSAFENAKKAKDEANKLYSLGCKAKRLPEPTLCKSLKSAVSIITYNQEQFPVLISTPTIFFSVKSMQKE